MCATEGEKKADTQGQVSQASVKDVFWSEKRIEVVIGRLLQLGVLLAAVVVMGGGAMYLFNGGEPASHYRLFTGERDDLRTVTGVVHDLPAHHARVIIQFGVLLLILTPISRVAFSAAAFALQKDYMYVVITLIVLAILIYSLAGHYI